MMVHRFWHWGAALLAFVVIVAAALAFGPVSLGLHDLIAVVTGRGSPMATAIVLTLRAPRIVLAALVGAALGMSGAVLQGTLRNPLAEPYLLGVSGGAAVGAVAAITLGLGVIGTPLAAFAGAAIAVGLAILVASGAAGGGPADSRTLLMAGVVVGAFANAIIMIMLANTPPNVVRGALWWMMGSVGDASWGTSGWLALYLFAGGALLVHHAREIDVLTLGGDAAAALGVDVERASRRAFLVSALVAAASVAAAGLVGFVGLIVPHLARAAGLSRHRPMLFASALIGAMLVVTADLLARIALPPAELPLGAVTAVLGVPFFLLQLWRSR
jgi:iron complex transport system permease protein